MKKLLLLIFTHLFFTVSLILITHDNVFAVEDKKCPNKYVEPDKITDDTSKYNRIDFGIQVSYDVDEKDPSQRFAFVADNGTGNDYISEWKIANENNQIFGHMLADSSHDPDQFKTNPDGTAKVHTLRLYRLSDQDYSNQINPDSPPSRNQLTKEYCELPLTYTVYRQYEEPQGQLDCQINTKPNSNIDENDPVFLTGTIDPPAKYSIESNIGSSIQTSYEGVIDFHGDKATSTYLPLPPDYNIIDTNLGTFDKGSHKITYTVTKTKVFCSGSGFGTTCNTIETAVVCKKSLEFCVGEECGDKKTVVEPPPQIPQNPPECYINHEDFGPILDCDSGDNFYKCYGCDGYGSDTPQSRFKQPDLTPLCDTIKSTLTEKQLEACRRCVIPHPTYPYIEGIDYKGVWTALGCIPTDPVKILNKWILAAAGFGIAGGVAFLYFLYGAFLILTSMGNPERINNGKEIMISSISGLLLIIFSIFILQVIGVQILRIPGFGEMEVEIMTIL